MNKKGFTMVELLATIVILGILSTIGIVTVVNIRTNEIEKFNNHQMEIFKQAGKAYFSDNKSILPHTPMGTNKVTLQELIDMNYLDSLLNSKGESYEKTSYILVRSLGNGKYAYISSLYDNEDEIPDHDSNTGKVSYGFIGFVRNETEKHYTNKDSKVKITMTDEDNIAAYKYTIISSNSKKESEYIFVNNENTKEITDYITISPKDFSDGVYKITIELWDMNGYKTTYKGKRPSGATDLIYIDTTAPTCEIKVNGSFSNGFYQSPVTLSLNLTDNDGSGILDYDLSTTKNPSSYNGKLTATQQTTNGVVWYGTVKDKTGNIGKCNTETIKVGAPKLCERAKTIHQDSYGVYGSPGTSGILASGDAFTCDVNGDGIYDEEKERFYYVSDRNNGVTIDASTAVLIYYSNVSGGVPTTSQGYYYNVNGNAYTGPATAIKQLPKTTQWKKVSLITTTRDITDQAGNVKARGFSYAGYAARLLTIQELGKACGLDVAKYIGIGYSYGFNQSLHECNYLLENTNSDLSYYWLESPSAEYYMEYTTDFNYRYAWQVDIYRSMVARIDYVEYGDYGSSTIETNEFIGVRPAIEVAKTDISY